MELVHLYDNQLIGMCVDMSLFGNPENTLEVSGKACEIGQSWSSLVNRCVANEGLTKASNDGSCSQGNYDSVSILAIRLVSVKTMTDVIFISVIEHVS